MPFMERPNDFFWDDFGRPEMFPKPKRERTAPVRPLVEEIQPISVLFVDGYNQVRSVLAQAQAEVVRLWTLNQRGYNLFSCVDSAGLRIGTPLTWKYNKSLTPSGKSPNRTAIDALFSDHELPKEKGDIRHRILHQQTSRGITYEDFDKFDYIFAFDNESLTDLRKLQWIAHHRAQRYGWARTKAKTRLLGDYNPIHGSTQIFSPAIIGRAHRYHFDSTIRSIEKELYNFLQAKTSWTPPTRIAPGALVNRYRSRQFVARNSRVADLKIRNLKLLHDKIHVDNKVEGRDTRVITVTAKDGSRLRGALEDAILVLA